MTVTPEEKDIFNLVANEIGRLLADLPPDMTIYILGSCLQEQITNRTPQDQWDKIFEPIPNLMKAAFKISAAAQQSK